MPEPLRRRTQKMAFLALLREEGRPARDQLIYPASVILSLLREPGGTLVQSLTDLLDLLKRKVLIESEVHSGFVQFDKPVTQVNYAAQFLYRESLGDPDSTVEEAVKVVAPYVVPNLKDDYILRVFRQFLKIAKLEADQQSLHKMLEEVFGVPNALDEGIAFVNSLEGRLGEVAYPITNIWRRRMSSSPNPDDIIDPRDQEKLEQIVRVLQGWELALLWEKVLRRPGMDPVEAGRSPVIEQFLTNLGTTARWEALYWEVHQLRENLRGTHQYYSFPNYVARRDHDDIVRILGCYPALATGTRDERKSFLEACDLAHLFDDESLSAGNRRFTGDLFRLAQEKVVVMPGVPRDGYHGERTILGRLLVYLYSTPCSDEAINQMLGGLIAKYHFKALS